MTLFETEIAIAAPAAQVWPILADVEQWPDWATSFASVTRLDDRPLGIGSRVRIKQPKLTAGEWTITDWQPGKNFTWEMRRAGVRVTGEHILIAEKNHCSFRQRLRFGGLLGMLSALMGRSLIKDYMAIEARGLKARCELGFGLD